MTFNLNKLQPELPSFEWDGVEYTATDKIFYPTARKKYVELLAAAEKQGAGNVKLQKKIDQHLVNFLNTLFPGTKKAKLFTLDSTLPNWAKVGLYNFVACTILNVPFVPPGNQFTHDEAEAMLALVVTEKAARELTSNEDIYAGLKEQIEKK